MARTPGETADLRAIKAKDLGDVQLEAGAGSFLETIKAVFRFRNTHIAVQVLMEDIAIAILFVRVAAVLQPLWAILLVAALFAAVPVVR